MLTARFYHILFSTQIISCFRPLRLRRQEFWNIIEEIDFITKLNIVTVYHGQSLTDFCCVWNTNAVYRYTITDLVDAKPPLNRVRPRELSQNLSLARFRFIGGALDRDWCTKVVLTCGLFLRGYTKYAINSTLTGISVFCGTL